MTQVEVQYRTRRGGWMHKRMPLASLEQEIQRLFARRTEADAYHHLGEGRLSEERCGGVEYDCDGRLTWWCETDEGD